MIMIHMLHRDGPSLAQTGNDHAPAKHRAGAECIDRLVDLLKRHGMDDRLDDALSYTVRMVRDSRSNPGCRGSTVLTSASSARALRKSSREP